jgi:hypothetical protein
MKPVPHFQSPCALDECSRRALFCINRRLHAISKPAS